MKFLSFLLSLCFILLVSTMGAAEQAPIINLITAPDAQYSFDESVPVLEVVFPRVFSSDCTIVRFGDETMLIDSSTNSPDMHERIKRAVDLMGITHFDIAYNSHPHRDHILGFPIIYEYAPFNQLYVTFTDDADFSQKKVAKFMREHDVAMPMIGNGDFLSLGENAEVSIAVIQRKENEYWSLNDRSAMLHITYGDRTILLAGDNENRAQTYFAENPPHVPLKADIMKI